MSGVLLVPPTEVGTVEPSIEWGMK